jgi:hypothetical protein
MTPHHGHCIPNVLESLYNRKLKKGKRIVENAFGILKQTWRELLNKTELEVTYLSDVITACTILHNFLLGQTIEDVERLLGVLKAEGWQEDSNDANQNGVVEDGPDYVKLEERPHGMELQRALGLYLCAQRGLL